MSFYAGMAEDEQLVFTMQLIKTIARSLSPHYRKYNNSAPLSEILGIMEVDGSMVFNDPVVNKFLWHIQCLTDNVVDFRQRMSVMARMNLGKHWSDHSSVGVGGSDIVGAIKQRGVEGLSQFVLSACNMTLEEIIKKTKASLNYYPSEKIGPLYNVIIRVNSLITDENNFVDSNIMDVLITFSPEILSKKLSTAMKVVLETHKSSECSEKMAKSLSSVILTEVTIRSNEEIICKIPLTHSGQESGKQFSRYSLEYRQALNAQGAGAYSLDFENMTVAGGESQVLLDLAKHFPRRAARNLRGGALEDSLGL
jgi:hypothetical protein